MKYLIFGGEGFIGSHLIKYLTVEKNVPARDVYSFDIKNSGKYANYSYLDVRKEITLDIPDLKNSIIFNLAAVHTTPGHEDIEYFETNIRGAENIAAFAEKNGITSIAFTSSIAPYGASEDNKKETTLPTPNTPYGISKLVAEHIFKTWQSNDKTGRKLLIVRPGVVFGKGEGGNFTRLYDALKKGFFFYPGRRDTLKASVYVKDVARVLYDGITSSLPENLDTYNLTYYPPPSIEEICMTISRVTSVSQPRILVPAWFLKSAASAVFGMGRLVGKKFSGIHPDRVKKLMISTNINGEKLSKSPLHLQYTLEEAIRDWFKDNDNKVIV